LRTVDLGRNAVLYEQGGRIDDVYFPDTAVLSLVTQVGADAVVEVATIGNESGVGLTVLLGVDLSVPRTLVQIEGAARCMAAAVFREAVAELPGFRAVAARSIYAFLAQVSLTAACNRLHGIEQRCARWLLLTHDRASGADTLALTHEFLSFMLGVRRAGVTEALASLTRAALIARARGQITILDRTGLEAAACECYAAGRRHAAEVLVARAPMA
jgi:CRP-like cAMP-binding protein